MIDYAFKSRVMNEHEQLFKDWHKAKNNDYKLFLLENGLINHINGDLNDFKTTHDIIIDCEKNGLNKEISEVIKINRSNRHKWQRLRKRIKTLLESGTCIFATFTFSPEILDNTTEKERRLQVVRYLKKYSRGYVANIDYGSHTEREHYHALCLAERLPQDKWHSHTYFERVNKPNGSKLAKYIVKLSSHAIKDTTKRTALIYSR